MSAHCNYCGKSIGGRGWCNEDCRAATEHFQKVKDEEMSNSVKRTTTTGPMTFDYNSAETLGWSPDMIGEATKRMHDLSAEYTKKSGICCPHCEVYIIRPDGGFPCEQGKDIEEFAQQLLDIAHRIGITNQKDSDARDELYALAKKCLK